MNLRQDLEASDQKISDSYDYIKQLMVNEKDSQISLPKEKRKITISPKIGITKSLAKWDY